MSNRFHSKFHRQNHHTYTGVTNPDAGHDPIASPHQPFKGDFILNGALSCVAAASSVAGFFYSNNLALCAVGYQNGAYISNTVGKGLEIYSLNEAISAYGSTLAANIYSPKYGMYLYGGNNALTTESGSKGITSHAPVYAGAFNSVLRALSAYGGNFGLDVNADAYGIRSSGGSYGGHFTSPNRGLSAYGGQVGLDVASNSYGIIAQGGNHAGLFFSSSTGIDVVGNKVGIGVNSPLLGAAISSPVIALSTGGKGVNIFQNRVGIFKTPLSSYAAYSLSSVVLDVNGNVFVDGNLTLTGDISAFGEMSYFSTSVFSSSALEILNYGGLSGAATFIQYGSNPSLACYSGDVSTSTPAFVVQKNKIGINTIDPQQELTITGNISGKGNLTIVGKTSSVGDTIIKGNLGVGAGINTATSTGITVITDGPSGGIFINKNNTASSFTNPNATLSLDTNRSFVGNYGGNFYISAFGNEIVSLSSFNGNDGKVSINQTLPTSWLTVKGRSTYNGDNEGVEHGITYTTGNGGQSVWLGYDATADYGYINVAKSGSIQPLVFQSRGGNVNIGKPSSSNSTLTVYGGISSLALSAYDIKLQHPTPNDGLNPKFSIGEVGDGSAGTVINAFSGFNLGYDELQNKFNISTQFGTTPPVSALTIDSTGLVYNNINIGNVVVSTPFNFLNAVGSCSAVMVVPNGYRFIADACYVILDIVAGASGTVNTAFTIRPYRSPTAVTSIPSNVSSTYQLMNTLAGSTGTLYTTLDYFYQSGIGSKAVYAASNEYVYIRNDIAPAVSLTQFTTLSGKVFLKGLLVPNPIFA
jgi:hypothetical protein